MAFKLLLTSLFVSLVFGLPAGQNAKKRAATYDYIVVGCGVSGLTVSMRLSADSSVSVLCLEAGPFDNYEELITVPEFIGLQPYGFYDWGVFTAPQTQLDGLAREIPMGKGVGGGSLINGMVWNRGNQADINAWGTLGNAGWNWDNLMTYFKRSETFTPVTYPNANPQPVTTDPSVHGTSGPIQVSYPEYFWTQSENFFQALNELGVPTVADPNSGSGAGAYFLPDDIDPVTQTRSDARRRYYDPYAGRPNYNVLANSQVTKILFSGSSPLVATGVTYASGPGAPVETAYASQQVIMAAGAVHTPQILQLSGVGPSGMLSDFGIEVLNDLPGVGMNLQDHPMIHLNYSYDAPGLITPITCQEEPAFNAQSEQEYFSSRTGPWTGRPSTAVAFPSLPQILADAAGLLSSAGQGSLPAGYESTLEAGYTQQFNTIIADLALDTTSAYEILNNNAGGLDLCLMHPLSRGTVQLNSADPFASPGVDPRWLVNPFDFNVMIAAMQFNQQILNTAPIQALQPTYSGGVPENATPDQLGALLKSLIGTEYHYSGTCAMLPLNMGGVVDSNLLVYGTSNLRVVDTSVFPIVPASHLQAVVYAVAEKAADIISGVI